MHATRGASNSVPPISAFSHATMPYSITLAAVQQMVANIKVKAMTIVSARSVIFGFAILALDAQPQQLTTDHTGSVLYFSSTLALPGQSDEPHSKIFRWDANQGVQVFLVRSRVPDITPPLPFDKWRTNFFELDSPTLSSDGARLAFVGHERGGFAAGLGAQAVAEVTIENPTGGIIQHGVIAASWPQCNQSSENVVF